MASVLFYPSASTSCWRSGLNIVVGQAGLLDLGYVAFFAIGAYTMAVLGSAHARPGRSGHALPFGDRAWP